MRVMRSISTVVVVVAVMVGAVQATPRCAAGGRASRGAIRHRARSGAAGRSGGAHRPAAQRAALLHPPQRAAGQPRVAASGGQRRLDPRGERSARARALSRAHGVQRHRELQAGRADHLSRVDRRPLRSARQRLHVVRRDRLHARRADRQAGLRRSRPAGAARLRRRHVAVRRKRSRKSAAS